MQERAESCTGQYEESKANLHKLGRGEMEEGKEVEEANTEESKPRRETRKLSSKLSRREADCIRGLTIFIICSLLRNFMETIFPMNEVKAVAWLPLKQGGSSGILFRRSRSSWTAPEHPATCSTAV